MTDSRAFQVDLRAIVDLLSHHLYASPRVYVRELLQNGVDAIVARRLTEPAAPAEVRIETPETTGDRTLRVHDSGVGLTEEQVNDLLATIGRSSKRDELGFARHDYLGQFGIGLLSCFMIADRIDVLTRAAGHPTIRWTGHADGRYEVAAAEVGRDAIGTTVTLTPRHGTERWVDRRTVTELAAYFGALLPAEITVDGETTTAGEPPWERPDRARALGDYARGTLGLDPFDVIELDVPEAGVRGAAYVLPYAANVAGRGGHRVHLKRMLLTESAEGLLPDWAFFVRCAVDATELRPTASREALYDDGLLASVREQLGDQIRDWLVRLARHQPARLASFMDIHHGGVKALALHDDEMLRLVDRFCPMETNVGEMTLAEFRERYGAVRYTSTLDQFRQLAAVAAAQHVPVVNGGYTYDAQIIARLPAIEPEIGVERLDPTELTTRLDPLDLADASAVAPFLAVAQRRLDRLGCDVVVRAFHPDNLASLYLVDKDAEFRAELRATREKSDPLWASVLGALDSTVGGGRPQLVLNYRSAVVRRILGRTEPEVVELAIESLYGRALLRGYHPIRPADAELLDRSFLGLLDRAFP